MVKVEKMENITQTIRDIPFIRYIPLVSISDAIEIALLTFIVYYAVKSLKDTRAWSLLKGVVIILLFYLTAYILNFNVITILFQNLLLFLGIAIIVIIQPELRKMIEKLGSKDFNISLKNIIALIFKDRKPKDTVQRLSDFSIQEIVRGCSLMGKAKTGALIVIECKTPLNEYVESGIKVNADITSQLFINIFEKNTPLHDGAVIIQNNRISAATCYLPLSDSKRINKDLGTRHRAGIGISEVTDSLTVIVSEETGAISVARNGKLLHNIDREKLAEELKSIQNIKVDKPVKKIQTQGVFRRNTLLKVQCIAASVILWMIVISSNNPVITTVIRNVPLEVINESYIEDTGKTYELIDGSTVDVRVKDTKEIVDRLNMDDIRAVVDLSKLSITNAVPIEVSISDYPSVDASPLQQMVNISLEDIITTEVDITIAEEGESNVNYYVSNVELDYNTIMISGAKSLINTIGEVVVYIDKSSITSDQTITVKPNIYDKNGELMDTSKFDINHSTIEATVSVSKTKLVPLNITTIIRNPVLNNIISSIDYDTKSVYVTGTDELLDSITSIDISIPLDISLGDIARSQYVRTVSLSEYITSELTVIPPYDRVNITVEFVDFYTKAITFNANQVGIEGLEEGLVATIEAKTFDVDIVDTNNGIENTTVTSVQPYINLAGLGEGEHEVTVQFRSLGDNIFGDLRAKVTITHSEVE